MLQDNFTDEFYNGYTWAALSLLEGVETVESIYEFIQNNEQSSFAIGAKMSVNRLLTLSYKNPKQLYILSRCL